MATPTWLAVGISGLALVLGTGWGGCGGGTDGEGKVISVSNDTVAIDRRQTPSASPLEFALNFEQVSGLGTDQNELSEWSSILIG